MGTAERRQREKEEREALFLDSARELIRTDGLVNLQMARLAEACDYATGTLYQHFRSKEDMLVALAGKGVARHVELFGRIQRWSATPRDRMFAIVVADAHFATTDPEQAQLVQYVFVEAVWESASEERRQRLLDGCRPIGDIVCAIVQEALDRGELESSGLNNSELALGPWCLCEGMHQLAHTRGLLDTFQITRASELLYRQTHVHLNGMGWQPLLDANDTAAIQTLVDRIHTEVLDQ